ncbi:MAG: SRPBCC family protein [Planctomycetota bacterium]|jgi:ligand-binding SRPBCC domain-containing protein
MIEITRNSEGYRLWAESVLPRPIEEVFAFFADADNLNQLTPPWLRFRILSPLPITMQKGARIEYRLRIHGAPVYWRTEISEWKPPHLFVDWQVRGPYRSWVHTHRFETVEGGTRVTDEVRYRVPGGPFVHGLLVRRDLLRIFE